MSTSSNEIAPDGSDVTRLGRLERGSMARFTFTAGSTGRAVRHRGVEELWYVLSGQGELWRSPEGGMAETIPLVPGLNLAIPARCAFQVKVSKDAPLVVIAVTMPPWPGDDEAEFVVGCWD